MDDTLEAQIAELRAANQALEDRLARLQGVFDHAPDAILLMDDTGHYVDANPAACKLLGYSRDDLLHMTPRQILSDLTVAAQVETGNYAGKLTLRRKNGTTVSTDSRAVANITPGTHLTILRDITQAEQALRNSEERYLFLTEHATDVIWTLDLNGTFGYISPSVQQLLGYTPEELVGQSINLVLSPPSLDIALRELEKRRHAQPTDQFQPLDLEQIRKDGSTVWAEIVATTIYDDQGHPVEFLGASRDITGRKKAEEALFKATYELDRMLQTLAEGIIQVNLSGELVYANPAAQRILQVPKDKILKQYYHERGWKQIDEHGQPFPEEQLPLVIALRERREIVGVEYGIHLPDGNTCWLSVNAAPLLDEQGQLYGAVANFHDVTERKRTEQALRDSESRYRLLAEHVGDVIWTLDLQGRFTYVSPSVERLRGYTADEVLQQPLSEVLTPESLKVATFELEKLFQAIAEGKARDYQPAPRYELEQPCKDGSTIWTEVITNVIFDEHDQPIGILGVTRDITERQKAQQALNKANHELDLMLQTLVEGIIRVNPAGEIVYVNPAALSILRSEPNEILGGHFNDSQWRLIDDLGHSIPSEQLPISIALSECRIIEGGELGIVVPGKELVWLSINAAPLVDEHGQIYGAIASFHDISERRLVESAFKHALETTQQRQVEVSALLTAAQSVLKNRDFNKTLRDIFDLARATINATDGCLALLHPNGTESVVYQEGALIESDHPVRLKAIQTGVINFQNQCLFAPIMLDGQVAGFLGLANKSGGFSENDARLSSAFAELAAVTLQNAHNWHALQSSEEKYRLVVERSNDGILLTDIDGRIVEFNPALTQITGISYAEAIGQYSWDLLWSVVPTELKTPENYEQIRQTLLECMQTGKGGLLNHLYQTTIQRPDGARRMIEQYAFEIEMLAGFRIAAIMRDVTDQKQSELALRTSEEQFRQLTENIYEAYWLRDLSTMQMIYVSPAYLGISGRSVESLLERPESFLEAVHIEDYGRVYRAMNAHDPHKFFDEEFRIVRPNGAIRWIHARTFPIRNDQGRIYRLAGIVSDITDRKQAEDILQTTADIVRTIPSGFFIYQFAAPNHLFLLSGNAEAERLTNIKIEDWIGQEFNEIWPQARAAGITDAYLNVMITGQTLELETVYADEHTLGVFKIRAFRIPSNRLAVAFEDISVQKQAQAELEKYQERLEELVQARTAELEAANQRLETLSRLKDEFVSNVSHELQTPITNLVLRSHLLDKHPDAVEKHLPVIEREIYRLGHTIDDLLALSRLDQDREPMRRMSIDLNQLVGLHVADRIMLAEKRGLSLVFEGQPDLLPILGDEGLLSQVLSILLTNALNFTPEGGLVTVSTHSQAKQDQLWVGFRVKDTGPGISPDEQNRLFERFFRGQAARAARVPGTGLGLALAKEIIKRHDGYIDVESTGVPGEGTAFSVWLLI